MTSGSPPTPAAAGPSRPLQDLGARFDGVVAPLLQTRVALYVEIALLFGSLWLLKDDYVKALRGQPEAVYAGKIVVIGALAQKKALLALLLTSTLPFVFWRRSSWASIEDKPRLRVMVIVAAFLLAWVFSTYSYNLWFDQSHVVDRLLVIVLAAGVVVHPAFIGPLFFVSLTLSGQFGIPLGAYSITDKRVLWDSIALFIFWLNMRAVFKVTPRSFVYVILVVIGAAYWEPARAKVARSPSWTEWALENDLAHIFISAHLNGWLANLSMDTAFDLGKVFSKLTVPMQVATLVLEAAGAILLFSRRLTIVLLISFLLMHVAIYFSSGILFWKWFLAELGVAWYLWKAGPNALKEFRGLPAAISVVLVVTSLYTLRPVALGWYDTPLTTHYQFWVVLENGERKLMGRNSFAPYDMVFSQNRFHYVNDTAQLTGTFGAAETYRTYKAVLEADTPEELETMRARAKSQKNEKRTRYLDRFLVRFFQNLERNGGSGYWLSSVRAPLHIWSWAPDDVAYDVKHPPSPVRKVEIRWLEQYYKDDQLLTIHDEIVHTVNVPRPKKLKR